MSIELDNEDAMGCLGCLLMVFAFFVMVAVVHFVLKFW